MKALYLFNGRPRVNTIEEARSGVSHDGSLYGMLRLPKLGIETDYAELEKRFSPKTATWLRIHALNVYFAHVLFAPTFLWGADVVFASTAFGSQLLWTLWPWKRSKWVMFDFSIGGFLRTQPGVKGKVFRWMVGRASGIVTIGREEAEDLQKLFPHIKERIQFIPLGVDTDFFKSQTDSSIKGSKGDKARASLMTSGFDPARDYKTLIAACKGIDAPVVVTTRIARAKKLSLPTNFIMKELSPRDLVKEYDAAAIFVLCLDIHDGTNDAAGCSTLVETMAMGKAIVATRTPTVESYITDGETGLLVEQGDVAGLKRAIERLLGDASLRQRLGTNARDFAVKNCGADIFAAKLAAFFAEIV